MSRKRTWYGRCAMALLMVALLFIGSASQWGWAQEDIEITVDTLAFDPDETDEDESLQDDEPEGESIPPETEDEPVDTPEGAPEHATEGEDELDSAEPPPIAPAPVPMPVASPAEAILAAEPEPMDQHEDEGGSESGADEEDTETDDMGIMAVDFAPFAVMIPVTVSHHRLNGVLLEPGTSTTVEAGGSFVPQDKKEPGFQSLYYTVNDGEDEYTLDTAAEDITEPIHIRIYYTSSQLTLTVPAGDWWFRVNQATNKQVVSPNYQFINDSEFDVDATLNYVLQSKPDRVKYWRNSNASGSAYGDYYLNIEPASINGNNAFDKSYNRIVMGQACGPLGKMGSRGSGSNVGAFTITGEFTGDLPTDPYRPELTIFLVFERAP